MAGHLFRAAIPTALAFCLVLFACKRWYRNKNTERNFAIMAVATLLIVGVMSSLSVVYKVRCPADPSQFCELNDSAPVMGTVVAIYVLVCLIRSWTLYEER